MDFVYDIDLVAGLGGGVVDLFAQAANIVNAGVAGGVDFNDIHGAALGYRQAHLAGVAGFFLIGAEAVDRFSQDAGGAGLARSPWAVEEIGVGDALALDGIAQSLGYRLLTDYIGQGLGAPLAIKNLRCHRCCLYYTLNWLVSKGDFGADRRFC
ncbi:hypothetical protein ES703_94094 [subsurface metagenome]